MLHGREINKCKSVRPPAVPVGAHLLLALELWRETWGKTGASTRLQLSEPWSGWKTHCSRAGAFPSRERGP